MGLVLHPPESQLAALRRRFDELRPELELHVAAPTADITGPRPVTVELIETTWQAVCSRPSGAPTYAAVVRELDCALHNWILRARITAGDLDHAFVYLLPHLRKWAINLSQGLAAPRPDPDDFVNDAFLKLRVAPAFCTVENPIGYAFRVVKNLVVDHARRTSRAAELAKQHPPGVPAVPAGSPERLDAIARRASLSAEERCMVFRKVFGGMSVSAAQRACGGPPGSPYYVLEKIYDKLARAFGVERNRP
jgi:DNA-directed RNA polymerase specialized sigma24 family protein